MENTKIIKRVAIILLCTVVLVSIGVNAYQFRQIKKFSQAAGNKIYSGGKAVSGITQEKDNLDMTAKRFPGSSQAKGHPINKEADELKEQIAEAREELAMVNKQLSDDEAKIAAEKKARLEQQNKFQKMSKVYQEDPAFKKIRRNSYKTGLNVQYADLFKKLNFSADKLDKFKDILVDEIEAQQQIWSQTGIDGSKTPSREQQEEYNKRIEALFKEYESKKAEALGKDGYAEYQAYNETTGERYAVNAFMQSYASNEKLTADQKEDLIESMHEEAKNVQFQFISSETPPTDDDKKEIMARQLDYQSRRDDAYLKAAKGILSASQYEQLDTYLKKQRDQYKLMMESSTFFNAQTEDEEGENKKSD